MKATNKPWWPTIRLLEVAAPAGGLLQVQATSNPSIYLIRMRDHEWANPVTVTINAAPRLTGWDVVRAQLEQEGSK